MKEISQQLRLRGEYQGDPCDISQFLFKFLGVKQ